MRVELQIVIKDSDILENTVEVYIGTSDSSGLKYLCNKTRGSIIDAVEDYLRFNLELEEDL